MIRRLLERIADWFTDNEWLDERRAQETAAIKSTHKIMRRMDVPFESDIFPKRVPRNAGGHRP